MAFLERPVLGGKVNFPISLAPMVGMSHVGLRRVVRHYTPPGAVTIWPTEMLSSWRIPREDLGATPETFLGEQEDHLVPQILGNEESAIRESVLKLVNWRAEGIDINMGCPVKKALKHNYGVALMGDAEYAAEVVRMTVRASTVPVSVKLRAGLSQDEDFLLRFVRGLEAAGASWLTLHPRLGTVKRRGAADWTQIRRAREAVGIAVLGNGDVQCADDVFAMHEVSGCDGVMVGRGLAARPWLMWQVGERLGWPSPIVGRRAPTTPEDEGREYGVALLLMCDELESHFGWDDVYKRMRFHVRMTCGWLEFGQHLFALVSKAKSSAELRDGVAGFFAQAQRMSLRTQLRE